MSRNLSTAAAVALLSLSTPVFAGGYDRSGQSVSVIFEDGRYAEFSIGGVFPSVSGTYAGGAVDSGDVGEPYFPLGAAYKADINQSLSYALIYDQPFGAKIAYPASEGIIPGTQATLSSHALTGVVRYKFNETFSVHGGIRGQIFNAENVEVPIVAGYTASAEPNLSFGYLLGAAVERKDIALRVALTYNSEISHDLDTTEASGAGAGDSTTEIHTPQSVNLEFQTGVAPNTLVFGSVRWVNWDGVDIAPAIYTGLAGPLVAYSDDRLTYSLGVGRKFNEQWSGAVQLGYERSIGGIAPNLGPTDGSFSVGLGATYTMANNTEITGGVRYVMIGDATSSGAGGNNGDFSGNSAIAAGLKVGFHF